MKLPTTRLLLIPLAIVVGGIAIFLTISHVIIPLFLWFSPTLNPYLYDWGLYGAFPSQTFITNGFASPRIVTIKEEGGCDGGLVFLTIQGDSVRQGGPAIFNSKNQLVWATTDYKYTMNFQPQLYQGKQYLTFWSGRKEGTLGLGSYYMLDESYRVAHEVSAVGDNLHGDLHEFKITQDDTALMTFYNVTPADLSSLGKFSNGWLIDSGFQEVDIETGNLLFEWRASDHFQVSETFMTNPFGGYIKSIPFDFFHINSVDKDSQGNYLISSRHTHTITCISPKGETLWILGGERNQFEDLSGGDALNFRWQHDARWVSEEEGIITLFDNKEAGPLHVDGPYSRGMMLKLDIAHKTVTLLHDYVSLQQGRAPSQGSVQFLREKNHVFVGWGHYPALSEFDADGNLLCETHYGASRLHFFGRVVSYRAFKNSDWVGKPLDPPVAKIQDQTLFVSWNGATEVSAWTLQGAEAQDGENEFIDLDIVDKDEFEESFDLSSLTGYSRFRVAALDKNGQLLGLSPVVTPQREGGWWSFLLVVFLWALVIRAGWSGYKWLSNRSDRIGLSWKGYLPLRNSA
ncbi:uncharacterized protein Z518_01335 [Rhinocladiella mackenziei CBS 650.93]|uniref:Arylsulfotransferase n=1 Tax=Rhinocladiella mackenziei CBS 650.93 TaxID=1442369 RepID=A0A0D2IW33_9EURO|nr:uncharacterized protein Z518_01335 [Rhinocladiella mackenziei CBS 650.93]KIX10254.1 hypothetical protein Z518_01335 [Rhinocladiella mackenziei CBS 650.93]